MTNYAENLSPSLYEFIPVSSDEPANPWVAIAPEPDTTAEAAANAETPRAMEPSLRVVDRLLDVFRQVSDLGESSEVKASDLKNFFNLAIPAAAALCTPDQREEFSTKIAAVTAISGAARLSVVAPIAESSDDEGKTNEPDLRRFAMVLSNYKRANEETAGAGWSASLHAQLVLLAIELAATKQELETLLRRIPQLASRRKNISVFQILAQAIPSWDVDIEQAPVVELPAMRKVIALAANENERATRLRELTMAAVDRVHAGAFSAAISMFELAATVLAEESLHATVVSRIQRDALLEMQSGTLERFVEDPSCYAHLRRVLAFFPELGDAPLLDRLPENRLDGERQFIRGLLQVWGEQAREKVLERLDAEIARDDADADVMEDLFDLIERIPRGNETNVPKEIEILGRACAPGRPRDVIKKALNLVSGIRFEAAGRLLARRLAEFEALPFRTDKSFYQIEELHELIDCTIAALARLGTPFALRSIVRHCLAANGLQGDGRARLRHLGSIDLSCDLDTVGVLWKTIRAELPTKILGAITTKRQNENPTPLIEALRSTKAESARRLLKEIATDYPQYDFGRVAGHILREQSRRAAEPPARENRGGDLSYYGLPRIIMSLLESEATGQLSLADGAQVIRARMLFASGQITRVEYGSLQGHAALYQLIERPVTGSFAFTARAPQKAATLEGLLDAPRILGEAMRRHDELRRIASIVTDDATFTPSAVRPSPDQSESDPHVLRSVWVGVSSGKPVHEWEAALEIDSWRARRIVARWIDEGSLESGDR